MINPVLLKLGPISLHWYSLMYAAAIATAYGLARRRLKRDPSLFSPEAFEAVIPWIILGLVVGARAGYVLFYDFSYFRAHPWEIILPFRWEGGFVFTGIRGLSYHGGLIGGLLAAVIFCRRKKLDAWRLADVLAEATPFGYTFGRLGNFLNGELYGRATSVPWGMVFPDDPSGLRRHPSQLYEALLEGVVLGLFLRWLARRPRPRGTILAAYVAGYGTVRFILEWFREPDVQLGFVLGPFTMGQVLCLLMAAGGLGAVLAINSKN
jgi:phosphatidylglycerol:prolipoprotein diacylglycerol transferase